MGKNYVTIPMSHSWERIRSFAPWVTHGIELRAFIACKMSRSMHNIYRERITSIVQKDIPVT